MISRFYIANSFKNDASDINHLGIIRGSMQRIIKNEIIGIEKDDLITNVDNIFAEYAFNDDIIQTNNSKKLFVAMHSEWENIKDIIRLYRIEPNEEYRQDLYLKSEKIWDVSNNVVTQAQFESELKLKYYKSFILGSIINLLIVFLIIYYVKIYIKDKLEVFAVHDQLTKTYNRHYFNEYINNEINKAYRDKGSFSILMLDIDNFKRINDKYGHEKGDHILKELALVVHNCIRTYDILVRFGGEEFIVILPETNLYDANETAERIRVAVQNNVFKGVHQITVSVGVATYIKEDTSDSIIKRADEAMYQAKKNGRNRVESQEIKDHK
jgi:diguanylate cyclase (GGDEF)-like protein